MSGEGAESKPSDSGELVFPRLKGQCSLNHIRVRGIRKFMVHCYLSLIVMQAKALTTEAKTLMFN